MLSFHLQPDRWSSGLLRKLFGPYQGHISKCSLPGARYNADAELEVVKKIKLGRMMINH